MRVKNLFAGAALAAVATGAVMTPGVAIAENIKEGASKTSAVATESKEGGDGITAKSDSGKQKRGKGNSKSDGKGDDEKIDRSFAAEKEDKEPWEERTALKLDDFGGGTAKDSAVSKVKQGMMEGVKKNLNYAKEVAHETSASAVTVSSEGVPVPVVAHMNEDFGALVDKNDFAKSLKDPEVFGQAFVDDNFVLATDELWKKGARDYYSNWLEALKDSDSVNKDIREKAGEVLDGLKSQDIGAEEFIEKGEGILGAIDSKDKQLGNKDVYLSVALDNFSYGSLYQKNGKDKSGDELYMSIDNEVFKEHRVTSYDTEDAMKRIDELGLN